MTTDMEPVHLVEDAETGSRFLIYSTQKGIRVELKYEEDTLWMSQAQMADLFGVDRTVITRHLANIFDEGELERDSVCAKYAHTAADGKTYEIQHYNLDAIISVGYRVSSTQGTVFRRWATDTLVQFATKGFVIDAERLKNPAAQDHLAELRETIRDIRADESNVYRELKRILTMCSDYDPSKEGTSQFYARMQAKIMYAVTSNTPSEILMERANSDHSNMGLRTWKGDEVRKADVEISKNYLSIHEVKELNRLTSILLDTFEDLVESGKLPTMVVAENKLHQTIANLGRVTLTHGGAVSSKAAKAHALEEYRKFDAKRKNIRHKEADKNLADLKAAAKSLTRPKKK